MTIVDTHRRQFEGILTFHKEILFSVSLTGTVRDMVFPKDLVDRGSQPRQESVVS